MSRWIRYGLPMIPAMVAGMIGAVFIAFPPPYTGAASVVISEPWRPVALFVLLMATYLVAAFSIRRTKEWPRYLLPLLPAALIGLLAVELWPAPAAPNLVPSGFYQPPPDLSWVAIVALVAGTYLFWFVVLRRSRP